MDQKARLGMRWFSLLMAPCLFLLLAPVAVAESPSTGDRVQVFYPKGDCETGWIDIEVYDRDVETWRAHSDHPRVATGTCQFEDPGVLLQEIRVRCADPQNRARVSAWRVGAEVFTPVSSGKCRKK